MEVLPDFDKEVIDGDDTINTDIKINPDYYIHHAITGAQEMLKKDDMKQGFIQYWSMIEHIEILASSASMLPDDYEKKISEFSNKEENKTGDVLIGKVKIANFKLQLILSEIFKKKTITSPLKVE